MNSTYIDAGRQTQKECPFPHGAGTPSPAFSVIDALPGFGRLDRRHEALNGSILARAAACKPLTDGNKAGLHFWFAEPVVLSRDPTQPVVQMTNELFETVHGRYDERLRELIARGLLVEDGYWHRRLAEGPIVRKGDFASIWTGLLVKPASGLWLLATGSYNRRAEVNIRDVAIASDDGYSPFILELDLNSMFKDTMWLEAEIACLIPLRPGVSFTRCSIRQRPELGAETNEFYTEKYLDLRGEGKAVGRYRKLLSQPGLAAAAPEPAQCELVHIAGPDVHTIETFDNVVGPQGPMPPETAAQLPFAVLRNFTPLEFDFDGVQSHLNNDDADSHGAELLSVWRELYGEESIRSIEWWAPYFLPSVPTLLGEPHFMMTPFVFLTTPPGWWTLADGAHYAGLDGLRGVIATDLFHHAGPVFQYRRPGDFRIGQGEPLMRLLPVPRHLLDAPHQIVELESVRLP